MNIIFRRFVACLVLALSLNALHAAPSNWPQFRGPESRGVAADDSRLPDTWNQTNNVAWKVAVPGRGWSSPIVWSNQVFLTTVISAGKEEQPKKGLYFGGERPEVSQAMHQFRVLCLDAATGQTRWSTDVCKGAPASSIHLKNTYASETPVTDGERVYALFGNTGLFCLDLNGAVLWSTNFGNFKTRYGWGTAASPVLHENTILVVNDNEEQSFLVALDKRTGKTHWQVPRDEPSNWATPFIWQNRERTEIVIPGRKRVRSYDLKGQVLWELGGMSSIVIPTPFAGKDLLYVNSGYVGDKVRPVFAIRPGAKGDISLASGQTTNQFIAWSQPAAGPYNPSPLLYADQFYILYDGGFLAAYDPRTGREIYAKERLNPNGIAQFTASPWAYNGKVFCLSEDGDTYVMDAGPTYRLIRKNPLDEMCMSTPAIADGSLYLRTLTSLYRIGNGKSAEP